MQASPVLPLPSPLDPFLASSYNPQNLDLANWPSTLLPVLSLYLDTRATPSSLFTSTRTSHRPHYSAARSRFSLPPLGGSADVILWNDHQLITETSIRNLAVWRDEKWITPDAHTGCLEGVARRWLLENEKIIEGTVRRDDVMVGEMVLIFNAIEGCRIGIVRNYVDA